MAEAVHPSVYTIPPHRAFADALAAGLLKMHGKDGLGLARGIILVPTNRTARAIQDAFVRRAEPGLLLPRLVPIGDPEIAETLGSALDPMGDGETAPPAIAPLERTMRLATLVQQVRERMGDPVDAGEAVRLARDLGATLDQLLIEKADPKQLADSVEADLSHHWQVSLDQLAVILDLWPKELERLGKIDMAERRNLLLDRISLRWRETPPPGFVVAAGIASTSPAVAGVLRTVSRMANGMVVLPALDITMPDEEWEALGPHEPDPQTGFRQRSIETHPQFALKLLLDRMGVAHGEVDRWRWGGGRDSPAVRTRAIGNAMAPANFTGKWNDLPPRERRLSGVRGLELATPAEEAQVIAIAMREAIEEPGRTAALVTPDRALARRVSAHLKRWGINADDSAGRPLAEEPSGTLLIALAETAAEGFSPVPLLALLKHPLVRFGGARGTWLSEVRRFDILMRGPRPRPGLDAVTAHLRAAMADAPERRKPGIAASLAWWEETAALLAPLEQVARATRDLPGLVTAVRETATRLAGDAVWSGPSGREAARFIADCEAQAALGPADAQIADLAPLLSHLMTDIAIRPPQGGHPRLFIWGVLEARLQQADVMILGGLNEGVWPNLPKPDPWLAPRLRTELGLPGLERRIGLAAHDFASALGGRQVLVTRARRDASAPAIASRFWLRLEAMTGGLTRAPRLKAWAQSIDRSRDRALPAERPEPRPPLADRPRQISVTKVDRLKADPFAFYAQAMLGLSRLDPVDAEPSPAFRGSAVHEILEDWFREDECDPDKLVARAEKLLDASDAHPLMRALWKPRLIEPIQWIAERVRAQLAQGRSPIAAEVDGQTDISGVTLTGKVDRIDRLADGRLAIVDYKTGQPPSPAAVEAGFAMQLGLLGLLADRGAFKGVEGDAAAFEYWSLAKDGDGFGFVKEPFRKRGDVEIDAENFVAHAASVFATAAEQWLIGDEPFTAKLHPEYAPYGEYDQLMRLQEWYGRGDG
ncbi:double-strand break repair protein AddB [Parasphingopyxis lamellibrachiae]|uniref:ATP-dependent helicase/nuclease subunit B n=1 Tax=Parasphingopyxis lamellibrachiae TaxID=680125 RepID=A0A3D9FCH4_9SPHN|nr:double-strand break repair protein AddB [Parasphingopyxis lamellibrachiae]RED15499.1 ATP-dependent helicase/nuclease subunit B [Parasphingopyxis lamellibrachiae]